MLFVRHSALLIIASASTSFAGSPNLVINGSFEDSSLDPGSTWSVLGGGNSSIDGWLTFGGGIDYLGTIITASDGIRSIDINNIFSGGGLQQTFDTIAGESYTVAFDMSANMFGAPNEKIMRVAAGDSSEDFVFDYVAAGSTAQDPMWERMEWSFVATGSSSTLSFTGVSSGVYGAALDNVVVTGPVPSPATLSLIGVAGVAFGRRRR